MSPIVPPDDSLAVLLKGIWPIVFTLLVALLKRRKTLLKWLKESVHILAEEEKRATDEHETVKPETNGVKEHYLEMNLEQFLERFRDTGEDIRDANRRIDRERKERLDTELTISTELAKLTLRIETYRRDSQMEIEKQTAETKQYVDGRFDEINTTMRRGFDNLLQAIQDMKDAAA